MRPNPVISATAGAALLAVATVASAAEPVAPVAARPSPLRAGAPIADGAGVRLQLDLAEYQRLRALPRVRLEAFPLDAQTTVALELEQFDVIAPDARILVGTADGSVAAPRPDVAHFRGRVAGDDDSSVVLSLSPHGSHGIIEHAGKRHVVATGREPGADTPAVYDLGALPAGSIAWREFDCHVESLREVGAPDEGRADVEAFQPGAIGHGDIDNPHIGGGYIGGSIDGGTSLCQSAEVAVETDWEFTNDLFGGDTDASAAYAATLFAAVSEIYRRELGRGLEVSFLRVWSTPSDPWTQAGAIAQLGEFQQYWQTQMITETRALAHFLSGRSLHSAGGVAYLEGLCEPNAGYGLSAHLNGSFPYPLAPSAQNWDVVVVAHELGHNFGAPHTHGMLPPIDQCASGYCLGAASGTIMSYCHLCPGGLANIQLEFHPRIVNEKIMPYLYNRDGCLNFTMPPTIASHPANQAVCAGDTVSFEVTPLDQSRIYSYQWRFNGVDIDGALGRTFTLTGVRPEDAGNYTVQVRNSCGIALSLSGTLTVEPRPFGDINCDGVIDVTDLLQVSADWGPCADCPADINHDGVVDITDLLAVLGAWSG
ncbi:MAG: M12 family metallo-peptidase [Planctomycetota bacterium]|jgi:hypothetical protein